MLLELLAKYDQIILYDEIRSEDNKIKYVSSTTYTDVSLDDNFDEFIVLSNDNGDLLKIYKDAYFEVTKLKFDRDRIDIHIENKKIKLFANYFSIVTINRYPCMV